MNEEKLKEAIKEIGIKINTISKKTEKENKKFFLFSSKAGIYLQEWNMLFNERNELKAQIKTLQQRNAEVQQKIENLIEKKIIAKGMNREYYEDMVTTMDVKKLFQELGFAKEDKTKIGDKK